MCVCVCACRRSACVCAVLAEVLGTLQTVVSRITQSITQSQRGARAVIQVNNSPSPSRANSTAQCPELTSRAW
eukprot:3194282-Rhodomonas_salina.1